MFPVIFSKIENTKSTISKQRCYKKTHLNTLNLKCPNKFLCIEILDGPLNVEINTYIRELGPILPQDNVSETKLSLTYNFKNFAVFIAEYNAKGATSVDI